jgi:hypothetical protein
VIPAYPSPRPTAVAAQFQRLGTPRAGVHRQHLPAVRQRCPAGMKPSGASYAPAPTPGEVGHRNHIAPPGANRSAAAVHSRTQGNSTAGAAARGVSLNPLSGESVYTRLGLTRRCAPGQIRCRPPHVDHRRGRMPLNTDIASPASISVGYTLPRMSSSSTL